MRQSAGCMSSYELLTALGTGAAAVSCKLPSWPAARRTAHAAGFSNELLDALHT